MTTTTDEALARLRHIAENFTDWPSSLYITVAIDEIARLRAIVSVDLIHSADWQRIADIRAAGYAAGQLAMRERAADQMGGYLATIIRNMQPIPEPASVVARSATTEAEPSPDHPAASTQAAPNTAP